MGFVLTTEKISQKQCIYVYGTHYSRAYSMISCQGLQVGT